MASEDYAVKLVLLERLVQRTVFNFLSPTSGAASPNRTALGNDSRRNGTEMGGSDKDASAASSNIKQSEASATIDLGQMYRLEQYRKEIGTRLDELAEHLQYGRDRQNVRGREKDTSGDDLADTRAWLEHQITLLDNFALTMREKIDEAAKAKVKSSVSASDISDNSEASSPDFYESAEVGSLEDTASTSSRDGEEPRKPFAAAALTDRELLFGKVRQRHQMAGASANDERQGDADAQGAKKSDTAISSARLRAERKEHQDLSGQLLRMAQLLKRNNVAIQEMLRKDSAVVASSEVLLSTNHMRFAKENAKLREYSKRSWSTTWMIWSLLFFTFGLFLFMYFFIRFTHK